MSRNWKTTKSNTILNKFRAFKHTNQANRLPEELIEIVEDHLFGSLTSYNDPQTLANAIRKKFPNSSKAIDHVNSGLRFNPMRIKMISRTGIDPLIQQRVSLSILYDEVILPENLIKLISTLNDNEFHDDFVLDTIRTFWVILYIGLNKEDLSEDETEDVRKIKELISSHPDLLKQYNNINYEMIIDKLVSPFGSIETTFNEHLIKKLLDNNSNLKPIILSKLMAIKAGDSSNFIEEYIDIVTNY